MASIALKSCKYTIKCDNGLTATGRASTRSNTYKGANQEATAEDIHSFFDAFYNLGTLDVLTTSMISENLVSSE